MLPFLTAYDPLDGSSGRDSDDSGTVDLPRDMVQRLRVDLSVWKPAIVRAD